MAGYNTFKVLQALTKDTYTPKKLKPPKVPKIQGYKGPKIKSVGDN